MPDQDSAVKRLADYRPCSFATDLELSFQLDPRETRVRTRYNVRRLIDDGKPLALDGVGLKIERIALDGQPISAQHYQQEPERLILETPFASTFKLEIDTVICPEDNTALEGLYISGGRFCTQCESEGFRHIAFSLDRPDVLSRFEVYMEADKARYPTLLSNGDLLDAGDAAGGRHYAIWKDPHLKPSYLFALVAGSFDTINDEHTTTSGRHVKLHIHTDQGDAERARYAMESLKRAMVWDERVFGREYDLGEFHIVAVRDFNFGAMENKGLNIFNSSRLLADPDTATDDDYEDIERVVGHEYFHNWTGNRITLRNWFQLCLKEGLTVYRDSEFSADQRSRAVKRIKDVQGLRERQFAEDAGPLAHAVRPDTYTEITNFYTATVYNKGAELVRTLRALIGEDNFFRGMGLYFRIWDGQAVTVEQFVECFAEVSKRKLTDFFRWYTQAGTPNLVTKGEYDAAAHVYRLKVSQSTPPTPNQPTKQALPIPLKVGFIAPDGAQLTAQLYDTPAPQSEFNLVLDNDSTTFVFDNVASEPIPALLRGFCAPVALDDGLGVRERLAQMAYDPDPFTRWDAGQSLMTAAILAEAAGTPDAVPPADQIAAALARELEQSEKDRAFTAVALRTPTLVRLIQFGDKPDPEKLFQARSALRRKIAQASKQRLEELAAASDADPNSPEQEHVGKRALRNTALDLLASLGTEQGALIMKAFEGARNLTERMGALVALAQLEGDLFDQALDAFIKQWQHIPIAVDKWFAVQAVAPREDAAARVRRLTEHKLFELKNPNRARSIYDAFGARNVRAFHAADGSGYEFLGDGIKKIDPINPMVAARLAKLFEPWRRFDSDRQSKARDVLQRLSSAGLSKNVQDILERTLKQ
ncbi:MAG: aminopeptidase N [Candidatus Korobacteraceae bacterium]